MARMKDATILIGVTFRDFNGSANEAIQRLFLQSINDQTYRNWKLVVTIFNEKHVQEEIEKCAMNAVFYTTGPVTEHRFSLTEVLLNTISESRREHNSIVLWTTCDILYQPDFFQKLIENYSENLFAISHPHITYNSIDDLGTNNCVAASINTGMDLIAMAGAIFASDEVVELVKKYKHYDWGIFEHFLVGLSQVVSGHNINLYGVSNISKIENDRQVNNETSLWLQNCWERNKVVLDQFISDYDLSKNLLNLTYCHMQFRILTNRYAHMLTFFKDYYDYYYGLAKSAVRPYVPVTLKNAIKKVLP